MNGARGKRCDIDGKPERVSIGSMRIKARMAIAGSILIMKGKETSRLGVGCSGWLDVWVAARSEPNMPVEAHLMALTKAP